MEYSKPNKKNPMGLFYHSMNWTEYKRKNAPKICDNIIRVKAK